MVHPMSIVWPCPFDVETYVQLGQEIEVPRPPCPRCSGPVQRWHGYQRHLRGDRDRLIWVPRVRCTDCRVTHALLPWFVLPWRWDEMKWIGKAVELAAGGMGHRRIATALGRSENTVRGWLRRIRRRAAELSRELLARATRWGWSSWETPTSGLPRLWAAVIAMAEQWTRRRGRGEMWSVANLITGGRLLATNTGTPLETKQTSGWMATKSNSEVWDDS